MLEFTVSIPSFADSIIRSPILSIKYVSLPLPPIIVSVPNPPSIIFEELLPIIILFSSFPLPSE